MIPAYNEHGNVSLLAEKIITKVDNLFNYEMLVIFRHMYEACKKNSIPTDIAPKIKVSLVVLPYEGRYFRKGYGFDDFIYGFKLALMRLLFRTYYGIKLLLK